MKYFILSLTSLSVLFAQDLAAGCAPSRGASSKSSTHTPSSAQTDTSEERGHYEPLTCPECNNCCGFNVPLPKPPCQSAYNTPEVINTCAAFDVYVTSSYLLWKACEENLELGHTFVENSPTDTESNETSDTIDDVDKIQGMDFHYSSGFKVGVGKFLQKDHWELYAEYTYFSQHATASTSASDTSSDNATNTGTTFLVPYWQFIPTRSGNFLIDRNLRFLDGSSRWNLNLQLGEVQLARRYYVGQYLTFRTFYGLQGSWIRQTYTADYNGNDDGGNLADITLQASSKNKAYSWGIGPRIGLNTNWKSYSEFRLFGDIAASVLYTNYYETSLQAEIKDLFLLDSFIISDRNLRTEINPNPSYLRANLDLALGAGWGSYFCGNRYYVDLTVGYSFHVFFNQNIFPSFPLVTIDPPQRRYLPIYTNLYLHGLDLTLSVQF